MPTSIVSCGRKRQRKFSAKLQEQIQNYFQEEITPLIHQAIELDTQEPISSEQLLAFAQVLEEELEKLNQDIEETPVKGKDERKIPRRKLKKVLRKVKDDFHTCYSMRSIKRHLKGSTAFPKPIQIPLLCE